MDKYYKINIDGEDKELSALDLELYLDSNWISSNDVVLNTKTGDKETVGDIVPTSSFELPELPALPASKVSNTSNLIVDHLDDETIESYRKSDQEEYLKGQISDLQRVVGVICDKLDNMTPVTSSSLDNTEEFKALEEELRSEIESLKSENETLKEVNIELESKLSKLEEEKQGVVEANQKLESDSKEKILKYKKAAKKFKNELEAQSEQNELLKKNVEHLNSKKREYAKRLKLSTKKLEEVQNFHENKDTKEEAKLVGSEFKIPNTNIWYLKQGDQESGPHAFEDILQLKALGKLHDDDLMKKEGEANFKKVSDRYEVNARLEQVVEDGQVFYLVSRSEYRAPFYDVVRFFIDDKEYKSHCTSLSTGGCFLEVGKMEEVFSKGATGTVYFGDSVLKEPIVCDFQIMRVSDSRPKGLGLKFERIAVKNTQVIEEYISNFLASQNKNSAA